MKKRRMGIDKRVRNIFGIVCLSFLIGTAIGTIGGNIISGKEEMELVSFLQETLENTTEASFTAIFMKYLKYDLMIWLGGWMSLGLFLSGAVFFFRSVAVGFTSAMVMTTYGMKGVLTVMTSFLPQNLLLIPTYLFIMSAAIYYLYSWQEGGGKRSLKRERRRKQTEYCIILLVSMIFLAAAAGIERAILLV